MTRPAGVGDIVAIAGSSVRWLVVDVEDGRQAPRIVVERRTPRLGIVTARPAASALVVLQRAR